MQLPKCDMFKDFFSLICEIHEITSIRITEANITEALRPYNFVKYIVTTFFCNLPNLLAISHPLVLSTTTVGYPISRYISAHTR